LIWNYEQDFVEALLKSCSGAYRSLFSSAVPPKTKFTMALKTLVAGPLLTLTLVLSVHGMPMALPSLDDGAYFQEIELFFKESRELLTNSKNSADVGVLIDEHHLAVTPSPPLDPFDPTLYNTFKIVIIMNDRHLRWVSQTRIWTETFSNRFD
jgi:hypothetical protein